MHGKNLAQYMADLCMLDRTETSIQTGTPKSVECTRIDVAMDEGPSHEEVQH